MAPLLNSLLASAALLAVVSARDVPGNVRSFVDAVRGQKQCKNVLAGGFHSSDNDSGSACRPV